MRMLLLGAALMVSGEAAAQFVPGGSAPRRPIPKGWTRPVERAPLIVDNARAEPSWLLDGDIRRRRAAGQLTTREARACRGRASRSRRCANATHATGCRRRKHASWNCAPGACATG